MQEESCLLYVYVASWACLGGLEVSLNFEWICLFDVMEHHYVVLDQYVTYHHP